MPRPIPENMPLLVDSMKRAVAALERSGVEAMVAGGLAIWARGGPATEHDVDLVVREEDIEAAVDALRDEGFTIEHPPEGWLVKAWDDGVLVDVIHRPAGGPTTVAFSRAQRLEIMAQPALVAAADDVLASKLLALTEHTLDYRPALEIARALREQMDWGHVRRVTDGSPFACAFLTLVTELGIAPRALPDAAPPDDVSRPLTGLG